MHSMFYGCSNLIPLDLSNFNTSYVTQMNYMFLGCNNLISLDLSNFNTNSNLKVNNMLTNCNDNLIYCINNTNLILDYISNLSYKFKNNNNYSDTCFDKNKKITLDNKKCVLNCTNNYTFEHNNICYSSCPNGTYKVSNNICIEYNNNNEYTSILPNTYLIDNITTYNFSTSI